MRAASRTMPAPKGQRLWRAFWAVMLAGHLPAVLSRLQQIVSAQGPEPEAAGVLLLVASCIFFALKLADVSWLRLKTDYRSKGIGLIVIALLHANVVQFTTEDRVSPLTIVWFHAIGVGALVGYRCVFDSCRAVGEKLARYSAQPRPNLAWRLQYTTGNHHMWAIASQTHGCRAPPQTM